MRKMLFPICAALAILGCGGENVGELPCFSCEDAFHSSGSPDESSSSLEPGSSSSSSSEAEQPSSSDAGLSSSSVFVPSSSSAAGGGTGSISYGGQAYRTVVIGTQTWFAENLNYDPGTGTSACYSNQASNCNTYGRLYDWNTAMTVCPSGWHLPSNADWDNLYRFVDGTSGTGSPYDSPTAGRYLKATSGWNSYDGVSGNGTDAHGFSALPGGGGLSGGSFNYVGNYGYWWSSNEDTATSAYYRSMYYSSEHANWYYNDKSDLLSVRCVKD